MTHCCLPVVLVLLLACASVESRGATPENRYQAARRSLASSPNITTDVYLAVLAFNESAQYLKTVGTALSASTDYDSGLLGGFQTAAEFVEGLTFLYTAQNKLDQAVLGDEEQDSSVYMTFLDHLVYINATYSHAATNESLAAYLGIPVTDVLVNKNVTDNDILRPVYTIIVNRTAGEVVLTVRGTITLADIITDLAASCIPFGSSTSLAHAGFVRSAQYILDQERSHLMRLLNQNGYKLKLTGHSLGAGVASLVALSLQRDRAFRDATNWTNIHAIVFSSPPILTIEEASYTRMFVRNILLQDDVVARSSLFNVQRLLYDLAFIREYDEGIRLSASVLGLSVGKSTVRTAAVGEDEPAEQQKTSSLDKPSPPTAATFSGTPCLLTLPGVVHQITRVETGTLFFKKTRYRLVTARPGWQHFTRFALDSDMISDHSVENIAYGLSQAYASTL